MRGEWTIMYLNDGYFMPIHWRKAKRLIRKGIAERANDAYGYGVIVFDE